MILARPGGTASLALRLRAGRRCAGCRRRGIRRAAPGPRPTTDRWPVSDRVPAAADHGQSRGVSGGVSWARSKVEDRTQLVAAHAAIGGEGAPAVADLVDPADGHASFRVAAARRRTVVVDDLTRRSAPPPRRDRSPDRSTASGRRRRHRRGRIARGPGAAWARRDPRSGDIAGTLEHDLADATAPWSPRRPSSSRSPRRSRA